MNNISLLAVTIALAFALAFTTSSCAAAGTGPATRAVEKELPPEKWTPVKGDFDPEAWKNFNILYIVDGETFIAAINSRMEMCRLLFVDVPNEGEPGWLAAKEALNALMWSRPHKEIWFEPPNEPKRDAAGRLMVNLYLLKIEWVGDEMRGTRQPSRDSRLACVELIRQGHSRYVKRNGRSLYYDDLLEGAEAEAKEEKRGIWAR